MAVVTGAAQGIGAAVAVALRAAGARVIGLDRQDPAGWAVGDLDARLDVTDGAAVRAAFADIERRIGPVHLVAHAAGALAVGSLLDESAEADVQRMLQVNTLGTWQVVSTAGRAMAGRGDGAIVVIGSDAAARARTRIGAYGASKAAAAALVRAIGLELAGRGVRCNVLAPGATDTPMQRALWPDPAADDGGAAVAAGDAGSFRGPIPIGRIADPADVAATAVFLLSPLARHLTMQVVTVDGGASL
ncbi:SDR family oxidoreductase [Nakamurella leprariae]|uniref:SDR family oxidoreductase n=1 Tax=Nakamurella leprariae TaxID=2803911 RepID=UPI0038B386B3